MSKKSNIKIAVKRAMKNYYKSGMTNTAHRVFTEINQAIDKAFKQK